MLHFEPYQNKVNNWGIVLFASKCKNQMWHVLPYSGVAPTGGNQDLPL